MVGVSPQGTSEPEGKAGNLRTQENFGKRGCAGQALSRVQEKAALLPIPAVSAKPPSSLGGLESRAGQEGVQDAGHKRGWDWGSWEAQGRAESAGAGLAPMGGGGRPTVRVVSEGARGVMCQHGLI